MGLNHADVLINPSISCLRKQISGGSVSIRTFTKPHYGSESNSWSYLVLDFAQSSKPCTGNTNPLIHTKMTTVVC